MVSPFSISNHNVVINKPKSTGTVQMNSSLSMTPVIISLLFTALISAAMAQPITERETMKFDVVELIDHNGNQVKGSDKFRVEFEGFRYFFANKENKAAFEKKPRRYHFQMDGRCGRMGSLSGQGTAELWTVHESRLYTFASKGCKSGFIKSPENSIEFDDSKPKFSTGAVKSGKTTFSKVLAFCGGRKNINAVKNVTRKYSETVELHGTKYQHVVSEIIDFDNPRYRLDESWNQQKTVKVLNGKHSHFINGGETRPMYQSGQREMVRRANRNLLAILKAATRDDFVVASLDKPGSINKVSTIAVYFDGILIQLRVNTKTGSVMSMTYRDRGPDHYLTQKTVHLSDYRVVAGVRLPHRQTAKFKSGGSNDPIEMEYGELNQTLGEKVFSRSSSGHTHRSN